jgi:hypothetical protein
MDEEMYKKLIAEGGGDDDDDDGKYLYFQIHEIRKFSMMQ